jgi:hypothetical protein
VKNKKGYSKIYVAVNIMTKKIVSMIIIKEKVQYGKMLLEIVNDDFKNHYIKNINFKKYRNTLSIWICDIPS